MYKDATYKQKYSDLAEWMPLIIEIVKRDLKADHLRKDLAFVKKFLQAKNINKLGTEELAQAYHRAIQEEEKGEEIAEFITSRWLLKNSELYDFFETHLNQITSDFTALDELDESTSHRLMEASIQHFGAPATYLFSVLNSVVFPASIFKQLKDRAQEASQQDAEQAEAAEEQLTIEKMHEHYQREIERLTDKYEKKLAGLQKKYVADTEGLKKQMAALQRQLKARTV